VNEHDKQKLTDMNAGLNRWANGMLTGHKPKQTRRLSHAAAVREADRCRRRMKIFGHY